MRNPQFISNSWKPTKTPWSCHNTTKHVVCVCVCVCVCSCVCVHVYMSECVCVWGGGGGGGGTEKGSGCMCYLWNVCNWWGIQNSQFSSNFVFVLITQHCTHEHMHVHMQDAHIYRHMSCTHKDAPTHTHTHTQIYYKTYQKTLNHDVCILVGLYTHTMLAELHTQIKNK